MATLLALVGVGAALSAPISPPVIQWQRTLGGTNNEYGASARETPDGGYIVAYYSDSHLFGSIDFWLIRLDSTGNRLWERAYGDELLAGVEMTSDGGFVLFGRNEDARLLRLDKDGNKLWDKTYGGTAQDFAFAVMQMDDGGFVVVGSSASVPSGNKTSPYFGVEDFWVFRTDADGNMLWDRSFGGSSFDAARSVRQTANGNIVVCGESMSPTNGNKTSLNLGNLDYWLIALDQDGNKLWERSYGGSSHDTPVKLEPLADGGFVIAGMSSSYPRATKESSCYGPCNFGGWPSGDFWLVRTDSSGNRLADFSFGGQDLDLLWDLITTSDGGVVVCGLALTGVSGNKTVPGHGSSDGWLVRLDSNFNKVWEMALGGTQSDIARSIRQTRDGGFIVGAYSTSGVGGNKTTAANGASDLWVVKLGPDALTAPQLRAPVQSAEEIRTFGFQLELLPPPNAPANAVYILESYSNQAGWTAFQTNHVAPVEFVDTAATNLPARYYRVRMER